MIGRRGFLKGVVAAPIALDTAKEVGIDMMVEADIAHYASMGGVAGNAARAMRGVAGETIQRLGLEVDTSAFTDALKLMRRFGPAMSPDMALSLSPDERSALLAGDLRRRRLSRLKSMSEAAREAYA